MKIRNSMLAVVCALLISGIAAAASITPEQAAWAKGPAQYLMTKHEMDQWKSIKSEEEANRFIDLFWAKRNPDPTKPGNAFRDRFEALVKYADEHFGHQKLPGSMTERGKVFILIGPPSRVAKTNTETISTVQSGSLKDVEGNLNEDNPPAETWIYETDHIPAYAGNQELRINFVDQFANGDFKLTNSRTNFTDLFKKSASAAILHPELTAVPQVAMAPAAPTMQAPSQAAPAVTVAPPPAAPALSTQFKTESLKTAVSEFNAAKTSPYKPSYVTYGEFITSSGEYFVPVELYVPASAALPSENLTFFGQIQDKDGNPVAVFEEPATLQQSKYDWYYDKSLPLQPGKYVGVFGLASDGKPLTMSRAELNLDPLTGTDPSMSRLILSNNLFALAEAQKPDDPYAFGGIKVVPKGDLTFHSSDELWYFFELRNPGVDESGNPKVQVKVDVQGTTAKGKKVKMSAPMSPANAELLKGVPGHYAVGSSIPLGGFEPGDYSMKLTVKDSLKSQTYTREQAFKITAEAGK
ncbi:MAG: GWxTD domain-containing protein [Acidobacteriota bacterium]